MNQYYLLNPKIPLEQDLLPIIPMLKVIQIITTIIIPYKLQCRLPILSPTLFIIEANHPDLL